MPKTHKRQNARKQKRHTRKRSGRVAVKRIPKALFKKLDGLSPFELNYKLIKMAGPNALNAGRGNPNFYNSFGRQVFADLQQAAIQLSTNKATDIDIYPLEKSMNFITALLGKQRDGHRDEASFLWST